MKYRVRGAGVKFVFDLICANFSLHISIVKLRSK